MLDPLLARARLAILESRALRREGECLKARTDEARAELRRNILETAMQQAEFKAVREDRRRGRPRDD